MTAAALALDCSCTPVTAYACGHCWHDQCLDCGQCAGPGCICHCLLGFDPREQTAAPHFWLGAHHARWLATAGVPLCVSRRTLMSRRSLPRAAWPWMLDSGGFTELSLYGTWTVSAEQYAAEVRRYANRIGLMAHAAPQDWMCEPEIVAKTGLTVAEHQARTVANFCQLRALAPGVPIMPVLQGWTLADYERCVRLYDRAGVDLAAEPLVGVGSVCRRQSTGEAAAILTALAGHGLALHGFGLKIDGLALAADALASADSLAWSRDARWSPPLPGCTHGSCANCQRFALTWRERVLDTLDRPRQLALALTSEPDRRPGRPVEAA